MATAKIRIGEKFNRLLIQDEYKKSGCKHRIALCLCDCGTVKEFNKNRVTSGATKSCGCYASEMARISINATRLTRVLSPEARKKMGGDTRFKPTHGMKKTPIYAVWNSMISRCTLESCTSYRNYGARGVYVCEKWRKFENFYSDMGDRPDGMTLERIDNDGNYFPENCKWDTPKNQSRNKRTNRLISYKGETRCLVEWSEIFNLKQNTLSRRLKLGWSLEKAFTQKVKVYAYL